MKPSITVSSQDLERIEALLDTLPPDSPAAQSLREELDRADILPPQEVPPSVVTMRSTVRFQIDESPETFCLTLSYPREMPDVPDGISLLTPIGTALLGLTVGDSMDWPRPDGQLVRVRIVEVLYQPERAGDFSR
ncbi:nucleoside diphosphate kinase regulator|uniref:nucleoside diphosphate kinase regulator n=1 Tax=Noviherbaspirillum sp. L7-7A TaxID=2850560 RepID=UPI001C2BF779|nr:nucleoside diphosphate kinase regulator [Noviherbaspirillum sp. L7-7A]MBV0881193.1 nucleoside diphosphate kinase regulator [Noviherbaspirillum sp. L7-7A]